MAVRDGRGARPGRAARGRAGITGLALALYLAAGVYAASPALGDARSHFLGYGKPVEGRVTPGDHLQTVYNLWLPGHQLARGAAPWVDPYSFQPLADERVNFPGWPFAIVFGPLKAIFGTVAGWNVFVLLTYVGAGGFTALWLRALGLPLGAALVGGLAFALAPYRSLQTAGGHLLGPVSMLLPLSLWAVERRWMWLATAALASIPLSGQVHLALGAIPFFVAYAYARGVRHRALLAAGGGIGAGVLVYLASIRGTTGASGRSFGQVERYSAELLDFVTRHSRHGFEAFVFLGWLTPLLALAGSVLLLRGKLVTLSYKPDRALAAVLAGAIAVPIVFALGANTPVYEPLWQAVPGLGHTRVPGRLLPVAALAIAATAAVAVAACNSELQARRRRGAAIGAAIAAVVIGADLRVDTYDAMVADEHNAIYASIPARGRLIEEPVFLPERQENSVYLYYSMQSPRERPLGYSTTAPRAAQEFARKVRRETVFTELATVANHVVQFRNGRPVRYIPIE